MDAEQLCEGTQRRCVLCQVSVERSGTVTSELDFSDAIE